MKIRFMLLAGTLLVGSGTSRADIIGGRVWCEPALNASGQVVTKCTNAPEGGGSDPSGGGWQEPYLGWNGDASTGIAVTYATYGANCNLALFGNATSALGLACDGASSCNYVVDYHVLGDPAPGCGKTFTAQYHCPGESIHIHHSVFVSAEAGFDKTAVLTCE